MRSWYALYKKEVTSLSFIALVSFLLVLGWEIFLWYKTPVWVEGLPLGLGFIPLSIYPLVMLGLGYFSFRQEWKDETIYFVLSLPRAGWQITLAKLAAATTYFLAITIANVALIYFFQQGIIREALADVPDFMINDLRGYVITYLLQGTVFYVLSGMLIYIITQFSQLISMFFNRFKGLISIVIFILTNYLIFRGGSILAPLFQWVPDIPIRSFNGNMEAINEFTIYIGSAPMVASVLITIGIFLAGSWLLERHLEV